MADARMPAEGRTVIGVCWQSGHLPGAPIFEEGRPRYGDRVEVPVRAGDEFEWRAPSHFEWHQLGMLRREPVVEVRRASGVREAFPAWLVAVVPHGRTSEDSNPDGTLRGAQTDAFCRFAGEVATPDPNTPRWRRIYEDVSADIAAGRLRPGDALPAVRRLAQMYGCTRPTVYRAVRRLAADGWVVVRGGRGQLAAERAARLGGDVVDKLGCGARPNREGGRDRSERQSCDRLQPGRQRISHSCAVLGRPGQLGGADLSG